MEEIIQNYKQKWKIPDTPWTISGVSRAANQTGFYIKELGIQLDAGTQLYTFPYHIFITHTHGDHIKLLPFTMIKDRHEGIPVDKYNSDQDRTIQIHGPASAEPYLDNYIRALFTTNAMDFNISNIGIRKYHYNGYHEPTQFRTSIKNNNFLINVFNCTHKIPTVSYGFSLILTKLKEEYLGLPGHQLKKLKETETITHEVINKKFAFVCDTNIKIFDNHPEILEYPTLMIECTFLYPEEKDNAERTKHIHWEDIKPYVIANPETLFVFFHFSLRYKEKEIVEFFEKVREEDSISNIMPWAGELILENSYTLEKGRKKIEKNHEKLGENFQNEISKWIDNIIETSFRKIKDFRDYV